MRNIRCVSRLAVGLVSALLSLTLGPSAALGQSLHQQSFRLGCSFLDIRKTANPATEWIRCGGATGQGSIAVWSPESTYGTLKPVPWGGITAACVTVVAATTIDVLNHIIQAQSVPDVRADSKTARRYRDTKYDVYVIYKNRRILRNVYKYGITRVGAQRPESQIIYCNGHYSANVCDWRWELTGVTGWFHARKEEAGLIAAYKKVMGQCPPGQYVSCR